MKITTISRQIESGIMDIWQWIKQLKIIFLNKGNHDTFNHTSSENSDPRPLITEKLSKGQLVVGWVTTSESRLLNVLHLYFLFPGAPCHTKA